jgi:hypothetical protein
MEPALDEAEITRERLALEEAIRKVEFEAASRSKRDVHADDSAGRPRHGPDDVQSLTDQGLLGFRQVVAEAESLGKASAKASRSAREFYDPVLPEAPAQIPAQTPATAQSVAAGPEDHHAPHDVPHDVPHDTPHDTPHDAPLVPPTATLDSPGDSDAARARDDRDGKTTAARDHEPVRHEGWPPPPAPPDGDFGDIYSTPRRSYRGLIRTIIIFGLIAGVAAVGYWQRDNIISMSSLLKKISSQSQPTQPEQRQAAPGRPKISDRVAPATKPSAAVPAAAPTAGVAQKVVLYEEDPNDPKGKRSVGSAIWKIETVSPGPGLAPELVVRADVEIPERRLRMTWSLRRNTDKALPASHTIEIMFTLPADFSEGAINNVPGVLMKQNEETRGVPLAGLAVKVTNGFFLIGLSAVEVDLQRNIQLLKERSWFDVPLVFTSNKRAILAVEKGTPGERAFEEAFRAWGQ